MGNRNLASKDAFPVDSISLEMGKLQDMTKKPEKIMTIESVSVKITNWMGTPQSLIVHTIIFIGIFSLPFFGFSFEEILLALTTAVSLEAIYLALFIQMTVNRNTQSLEDVEEDIDEIQQDVEEIEGDFGEIQEDVEDLETNIQMVNRNVQELEDDVEEISEDIGQIQLDDKEDDTQEEKDRKVLRNIETYLTKMAQDINSLKKDVNTLKKA